MSPIYDFNGSYEELVNSVLESGKPAAVIFYDKCCPSLTRFLYDLRKDVCNNPNVLFLKVDIEQNQEIRKKISINSEIVIKFFKSNKGKVNEVAQVLGANLPMTRSSIIDVQKYITFW